MTAFSWVAMVVAAMLYWGFPRKGIDSFTGSVLVGFIWPVLLVVAPYFWVKWRVLKWPSSPAVMQLEIGGCTVVEVMGMLTYLWLTNDPVLQAFPL